MHKSLVHIGTAGAKYTAALISNAIGVHASAINQAVMVIIFQNCDKPGRSVFWMQTGMAAAAAGDCGWVTSENGLGERGCCDRYRLYGTGFRREKGWSPDLGQQLSTIREREKES